MTLKPAAVDYMISTYNVGSAFGVCEFQANPTFDSLINDFCFTKTDLLWSTAVILYINCFGKQLM